MRRFLFLALCAGLFPHTGLAGTLTETSGDSCQLRFEGTIASGDADRLKAGLGAFDFGDGETSDQILCVSGPGGAFSEAIAMGKILIEHGIGTRIEANESCLSACAVLFMMGSRYFYEGVGNGQNANRRMHATSRLGFHRPELRLNTDRVFDTSAVERSFDVAIQATLEFVRLANEGSRLSTMVPSDLIEEMFTHKGEDFFFVETTGQAARWDIQIDGLVLPRTMGPEAAWNACTNLGIWPSRYEPDAPAYPGQGVEVLKIEYGAPIYGVAGPFQSDAPHYCILQMVGPYDGLPSIYGCGLLGRENRTIGESICMSPDEVGKIAYITSDARVLLPPDTPLTETEAATRALEAREGHTDGGLVRVFRDNCSDNAGVARVTNVTAFTNLRSGPSIRAAKLEEVALDAAVQLEPWGSMTPDAGGISAQCAHLCQAAGNGQLRAADRPALDTCYDSNAFWFRVRTGAGRDGYLSGKFLRR